MRPGQHSARRKSTQGAARRARLSARQPAQRLRWPEPVARAAGLPCRGLASVAPDRPCEGGQRPRAANRCTPPRRGPPARDERVAGMSQALGPQPPAKPGPLSPMGGHRRLLCRPPGAGACTRASSDSAVHSFARRLGLVARAVDGLQVIVIVFAAPGTRHDVVDLMGCADAPELLALLASAHATIAPHDVLTNAAPFGPVAALCRGAAALVGE
jgi:hypothetical protein